MSLKSKNSELEELKLFYQIEKISYIKKYIKTTWKFEKLYSLSRSILLKKFYIKKRKLVLPNNVSSFELLRTKFKKNKGEIKLKSLFQRLNFGINYVENLRAKVVLEYFKSK